MSRHPQWEERLSAFIAANLTRPHDYAKGWDCLLGLSAGAARAVTGKDYARGHRGKYKSHASAYRYLKKLGFESPEQFLDDLFDQKPVGFAGRGDLVLCDLSEIEAENSPAGPVPGVCLGSFALCIVAEHEASGPGSGLVSVPRGDKWLKAWAVGDHHSGCRTIDE